LIRGSLSFLSFSLRTAVLGRNARSIVQIVETHVRNEVYCPPPWNHEKALRTFTAGFPGENAPFFQPAPGIGSNFLIFDKNVTAPREPRSGGDVTPAEEFLSRFLGEYSLSPNLALIDAARVNARFSPLKGGSPRPARRLISNDVLAVRLFTLCPLHQPAPIFHYLPLPLCN